MTLLEYQLLWTVCRPFGLVSKTDSGWLFISPAFLFSNFFFFLIYPPHVSFLFALPSIVSLSFLFFIFVQNSFIEVSELVSSPHSALTLHHQGEALICLTCFIFQVLLAQVRLYYSECVFWAVFVWWSRWWVWDTVVPVVYLHCLVRLDGWSYFKNSKTIFLGKAWGANTLRANVLVWD